VEFYAPWCGHCKSLAPEYAKAATQLANANSEVKLAKVDATEHKVVGGKYGIKGFPTLKFFRHGANSEYQGGRKADEIVAWVSKKTGPIATTVATLDDFTNMQEANDVFVIGCFADVAGSAAKAFLESAGASEAHTFAITSSAQVLGHLGVKDDHVVVIKTFDELRNDFPVSASTKSQQITDFISGHAVPLVQVFTDETSANIFKSPIQKHSLFFTVAGSAEHDAVTAAFRTVGKDFRGKTMMINVPDNQARVAEYFGLKKSDFPAAVFADMSGGGMKKYPFNVALDQPEAISDFLTKALSGALTPTLKSETPTPADTAGPVTVLTGKSFADLVLNNSNDVLVEFYAPWCGHCKNLAPIWEELGAKFSGNEKIVIAKMDSTANEIEVPGVEVKGFPTLYFFKGDNKKKPVKYEGGRTLDALLEYLQKNASNDVGDVKVAAAEAADEDDENDEL
jgi:protein disulfide-isomerase A1